MTTQTLRAVVSSVLLALGACSGPPPEQQIASAQQHLDKGDWRVAYIELKSALQAEPDNATARRLLGEIQLAAGEAESAEKELRVAKDRGAPPELVTPPLANALLLQGRFDEVLAIAGDSAVVASAPAELNAARARAMLGLGDVSGAELALGVALAADPRNASVLLARAEVEEWRGKPDEAIATLREAVSLHPSNGLAWSNLGALLADARDFAGAEEAFTKAIEHRARSLDDQLRRAIARLAQNKLEAARDDVDTLLTVAPKVPRVQFVAGLWRTKRGQPERAVEALELSYGADPDFAPTLLLLASNYVTLGRLDRARQLADQLGSLSPGLIPGRLLRARLLLLDGKAAEAEELLRPVVEKRPELAEAVQLLATAQIHQGEAAEAEKLLAEIAAVQPDSPLVQLQLGVARSAAGKPKEGLDAMEKAGRLAPDDRVVQAALVAEKLRQQDPDGALALAERLAAQHPGDASAHALAGSVHVARKEAEQAVAAFEKALALDPGNPAASQGLASIRVAQGDLAKAGSLLAEAAKGHPDDLALALSRAAVLERQGGDTAGLSELLRATVQRHPDDAPARIALGRLRLAEGKPSEAAIVLDRPAVRARPAGVLLLAEAWRRTGKLDEARAVLEVLDRSSPGSAPVLGELGAVLEAQGDWAGAQRVLDQLLALTPDAAGLELARARLLAAQGRADEAGRLLAGLKLDPASPEVLRTRVVVARRAGDLAGEVGAIRTLFEREPSTATVIALATAQARAGARDEALASLADWTDNHPADQAALLVLGGLYVEADRVDDGLAVYRRVLALDPGNLTALNGLAWHLRRTSPKEARELAERAYGRAPDAPEIADTLAMILLEFGEIQQALDLNDKAVRLAPQDPRFQLSRVEILARRGETATARRLLEGLPLEDLTPAARADADRLRQTLGR